MGDAPRSLVALLLGMTGVKAHLGNGLPVELSCAELIVPHSNRSC